MTIRLSFFYSLFLRKYSCMTTMSKQNCDTFMTLLGTIEKSVIATSH